MITRQHHIIESARIEVSSPTGNHALQQGVANWWSATAVPAIEEVLEELLPGGAHLRLDLLELDLGHFKRLDPDLPGDRDELTERLRKSLRVALGERLDKARVESSLAPADEVRSDQQPVRQGDKTVASTEQQKFAAWLYFLEYGHRPWWSVAFPPAAEWAAFIERSLSQPERRAATAKLVRRSRAAALRLAADERHTVALTSLLKSNESLKAAWTHWRIAAPAYADLAAQLPTSAPPATEWTTAGRVACWWFALTETQLGSEAAALKALLTVVIPSVERWPEEQAGGLLALLKLPTVTPVEKPPAKQRAPEKRDSDVEEKAAAQDIGNTNTTKETGQHEAASLPPTQPGEETSITTRVNEQVADPGNNAKSVEEQTPVLSEHTSVPSSAPAPDEKLPLEATSDEELIKSADQDVPPTVAWAEAGLTTPIAPAAAPPNAAEAWYVDHAGVVLTHPFLAPLFTALGYWLDGAFVDETAQQRAVYLTHYLATGAKESHEEDLPLCKLLCGWPVSGPPARLTVPLTDTDRHEADEVLRSVIEHWQAIGAASVEGLREGFFAREGRLRAGENGWQITVDRRAQDILLGRLPWGISLVQAPWHDSFIKVEW